MPEPGGDRKQESSPELMADRVVRLESVIRRTKIRLSELLERLDEVLNERD